MPDDEVTVRGRHGLGAMVTLPEFRTGLATDALTADDRHRLVDQAEALLEASTSTCRSSGRCTRSTRCSACGCCATGCPELTEDEFHRTSCCRPSSTCATCTPTTSSRSVPADRLPRDPRRAPPGRRRRPLRDLQGLGAPRGGPEPGRRGGDHALERHADRDRRRAQRRARGRQQPRRPAGAGSRAPDDAVGAHVAATGRGLGHAELHGNRRRGARVAAALAGLRPQGGDHRRHGRLDPAGRGRGGGRPPRGPRPADRGRAPGQAAALRARLARRGAPRPPQPGRGPAGHRRAGRRGRRPDHAARRAEGAHRHHDPRHVRPPADLHVPHAGQQRRRVRAGGRAAARAAAAERARPRRPRQRRRLRDRCRVPAAVPLAADRHARADAVRQHAARPRTCAGPSPTTRRGGRRSTSRSRPAPSTPARCRSTRRRRSTPSASSTTVRSSWSPTGCATAPATSSPPGSRTTGSGRSSGSTRTPAPAAPTSSPTATCAPSGPAGRSPPCPAAPTSASRCAAACASATASASPSRTSASCRTSATT